MPGHVEDAARLVGVWKSYRHGEQSSPALAGVDVAFARGTFTAVMGPSGSGKSTLLHCAAGLDAPTSGNVLLEGADIGRMSDRELTRFRRARVGFVFQSFNLLPALTVEQNVTLPREMGGEPSPDPAELDAVLERVGLDGRRDHLPAELSGGQQQRAAIARALFTRPAVVFADEPTGALDTRTARSVLTLFADAVHTQGQTIVMVTHDPVAASYADRIVFLADGTIATERGPSTAAEVAETLTRLGEPALSGAPGRPRSPAPASTSGDRPAEPDRPRTPEIVARPAPSETAPPQTAPPQSAPPQTGGRRDPFAAVRRHGPLLLRMLGGVGLGLLALPATLLFLVTLVLVPVGVGVLLLPPAVAVVRGVAGLGRRQVARTGGQEIADPYEGPEQHRWRRFAQVVGESATWRDALWAAIRSTLGLVVCLLPVMFVVQGGFGLLMPILWPLLVADGGPWWYLALPVEGVGSAITAAALGVLLVVAAPSVGARAERLVTWTGRRLLAPDPRGLLRARVRELATSRDEAVEDSASSVRRIERDLHDGAQARLVALGMKLSTMDALLESDIVRARELLDGARSESESALQELQDLVRGIHPPVLADRGLADAVRALALSSPLTVQTDVVLPNRPGSATETALYFAVSELLTNAAKHGGARSARVTLRRRDDLLVAEVDDDGSGGADPSGGTGLLGVARRLAALDGTIRVTSPHGGPTSVRLEVPWTSS